MSVLFQMAKETTRHLIQLLLYRSLTKDRLNTAISRKVVGKNVHATIPTGNMGYDQYTVPDFVAVEPTFVAFL